MVYTNDSRLRWITKSGSNPGEYEGYSYDAAGNVNFQRRGAADTWYEYDRNRLLCAGSTSSDPCAAGSANYNYDAFGRLDTVTSSDKLVERYGYDGFDRVVSHRKYDPATGALKSGQTTAFDPLDRTTQESTQVGTGPVKTTTFTHLGMSDQIISEEQPDPGAGGVAKTTATYTYGPGGERISQTKSPLAGGASETSYYGVNPHTDVETLTSESGNTRSTYRYTGYGENDGAGFSGKDKATATGGPEVEADNPYRFNSKRWDPATGGYDMGFRDYSPGLNRFLTRDMYNGALSDLRLGSDPWTGNRYAFAGGNPITGIEYDGHCPMADEGGCDTNANYEIYVPPAVSDKGGTHGRDSSEGDSVSDFQVKARSHPDRILEMGDGCSHGQRFGCVLPEGGFKALDDDGYGPYVETDGDKGVDALLVVGTLWVPGGGVGRGVLAIRAARAAKIAPAANGASRLAEASSAALRAADDPASMFIKNKHLASVGGNQAKFASNDISEVQGWISRGLQSDGVQFLPNGLDDTFRAIVPAGRVIGTRGQTNIRVIVTNDGRVINAFPVNVR